jgi:hypothetical protein
MALGRGAELARRARSTLRTIAFPAQRAFRDIPRLVKELGKHRFTCFAGVNVLFKGSSTILISPRLSFMTSSQLASGLPKEA